MSFDELPADAPRPHEGEAAAADREPSDRNAPPAARARRRRAPQSGTDAASTETAETPVSGKTDKGTRRKADKEKTEARSQKPDVATPDALPSAAEAQAAAPAVEPGTERKRRGSRVTRETAAPADASADAVAGKADSIPAASEAAAEPKRRQRSRRAVSEAPVTATPDTVASVSPQNTPPAASADTSAPASPSADTPEPAVSPRTSRRSRTRADAESTPEASGEEKSEAPTSNTEHQGATGGQAPNTDSAPSGSRQRNGRSRRGRGTAGETIGASEEATLASESIDADRVAAQNAGLESDAASVVDPAQAEANAGADTRGRQGKSTRRRGNSRRGSENVVPVADARQNEAVPTSHVEGTEASDGGSADADADENADENGDGAETAGEGGETRSRRKRNRRSSRSRREARGPSETPAPAADTPAKISAEIVGETARGETPVPVAAEEIVAPIDLSVGAHLIMRNGVPRIHINGVAYPPTLFFGNMEGAKNAQRVLSEVRRAAKAGVHLHSTLLELPCPLTEAHYVLDEIDARLRALVDADPDGFVMPRLVFVPARGWKREYPTEISVYADGTNGDPSLTSERFWQECERALQMLIEHIQGQTYGERVFAYHLERGEWFQPLDQGYDRSMANRDAFRDWLREKYKHSLILLRAAWHNGDVQFHTAEIPPALGKPNPQRAFYETRRERSIIDFNEFTSESTASRLARLARTVKKASFNNALVSVCYGYSLEFGHGFSGHLALNQLLASPHVDLICGPPSYRDRKPTGAASFPAPVDSPPLHGKLWLSEDDTKTYLAPAQQDPDDFNPRLSDRFATEQAQARTVGRALATNTGVGWMDLWGEGWLDDEGLWERIGAFTTRLAAQQRDPLAPASPDVVALIDERSLLHVQKGEPFFRRLTNGLRDTLQRAGVNYGLYLQSDVTADTFPTNARLYLFLTPFRLTAEQRATIKAKLQRDGKTLAWLYAPGACEERPSGGSGVEEVATTTIGIALRQQSWNSEVGSRVIEQNHALTERLGGRDIGTRERLNPSFYVDDPGATLLAEYQGSGLPSLAVRSLGNWKSVFVGDPILPLELLRGICRYAGVPIYVTGGEDVVFIGSGWITVHASRDGQRTLRLPANQSIYDMQEQRIVAENTRDYRYFLRMGATRTFCVGTRERFVALGLPNLVSPTPRTAGEREPSERYPVERENVPADAPDRSDAEPEAERGEPERNGMERDEERSDPPVAAPETDTRASQIRQPEGRIPTGSQPDVREGSEPLPPVVEREAAPAASPKQDVAAFSVAESDVAPVPSDSAAIEAAFPPFPAPEEEELPFIEPFPQPRQTPRPPLSSLSSAPPSLRADLETLKAVLEMEMPEEEEEADHASPPTPLPGSSLPGLEAVLGPELSANRRRRRRGGRGRGRKPGTGEEEDTSAPPAWRSEQRQAEQKQSEENRQD